MNTTNCTRCQHADANHCYECRPCHYVSLVMLIVHKYWQEGKKVDNEQFSEIEGIGRQLRGSNIRDFTNQAKTRGAFLSAKLGNLIIDLSHPAGISPDDLKSLVCKAIDHYRGEMEGLRKYEARPGNAGKYMQHWYETVGTWFGGVKKSINS